MTALFLHMRQMAIQVRVLQFTLIMLLGFCKSDLPPAMSPQPLIPLLGPSPLLPFTNIGVPKLSGQCALDFSSAQSLLTKTSTDCWASLAPYLANVVCCPQLEATLTIMVGKSSKNSGKISLNATEAKYCLSDVEQILVSQGANDNLTKMCSLFPSNLTESSCPLIDVKEIEKLVDIRNIVSACEKADLGNECCEQKCENEVLNAAEKIAKSSFGMSGLGGALDSPSLTVINDCRSIVLRWLAAELDISSANKILRGISACQINKVCPLTFPDLKNISIECGNTTNNGSFCCEAMGNYISSLQDQSFITSLQAFNCAILLAEKLQKENISSNVYDLCHINLKDFSLQVGSQDSGCLLPSLASDVTYDNSIGISFVCDLNDKVAAPWPSDSFNPVSSCNQSTQLPAVPKATSAQIGMYIKNINYLFFTSLVVLKLLVI